MSHIPQDITRSRRSFADNWSLASLMGLFGKWMEGSRDRLHLLELDDRMLADIGMTRRDVEKLNNAAFWRL
ncbi:MAG TPA: DUF1127 domain-containing protein [Terriglobia bacterium]|nr:DUF1127 domain-containing protein [Terriglobia bacterium]